MEPRSVGRDVKKGCRGFLRRRRRTTGATPALTFEGADLLPSRAKKRDREAECREILFVYSFISVSTVFMTHEMQPRSGLIMFIKSGTAGALTTQRLSAPVRPCLPAFVCNEAAPTQP